MINFEKINENYKNYWNFLAEKLIDNLCSKFINL